MAGKQRATTIQQRFGFADGDLKQQAHDDLMMWLDKHVFEILSLCHQDDTSFGIIAKQWEHPITDKTFIIGFVDMLVRYCGERGEVFQSIFEVKTKIQSVGELLRQINMYKVYKKSAAYFIVSTDDRYIAPITSQGCLFVLVKEDSFTIHGNYDRYIASTHMFR